MLYSPLLSEAANIRASELKANFSNTRPNGTSCFTAMSELGIGILALQGAFQEHADILKKLSVEYKFIRSISDLDTKLDGIILPGGESTVQRKLAKELGLLEPLKLLIKKGYRRLELAQDSF